MLPTTRAEAKRLGSKWYFTGKPCVRGHIEPRFTSIGKCKACSREDAMAAYNPKTDIKRRYKDQSSFITAAKKVHGGKYNYDRVKYESARTLVDIICPEHGVFRQRPYNHVGLGQGCPECGSARVGKMCRGNTEAFIEKAEKLWDGLYSYEKVEYEAAHKKVSITCREHGEFEQTPTNHLSLKIGCPKCSHMKSSGEDELARFLSRFTAVIRRTRTIIPPKELDIYLPEQGLAIEYCGEYWHSHWDAEDEKARKHQHMEKYQACAEKGIRLITLFETEYLQRPQVIRRLLRNAVGASRGRLMARKCELRKVSTQEARRFYDRYHPQGGAGHGEHYALFWKGKMVACMRFVLGANDRGNAKARVWTLGRYATRVNVAGAASRLFKAFVEEYNPPCVKSFSDNRLFGGGMYEKLGFVLEADVAPDYQVWSPKLGLRPKPHYQRRQLQKRLHDHGIMEEFDHETDPRTEAEMTYYMGAARIYDCGKKRWVWRRV